MTCVLNTSLAFPLVSKLPMTYGSLLPPKRSAFRKSRAQYTQTFILTPLPCASWARRSATVARSIRVLTGTPDCITGHSWHCTSMRAAMAPSNGKRLASRSRFSLWSTCWMSSLAEPSELGSSLFAWEKTSRFSSACLGSRRKSTKASLKITSRQPLFSVIAIPKSFVAVFSSMSSTSAMHSMGTPFDKRMPILRARTSLCSSVSASPATDPLYGSLRFVEWLVTPSVLVATSLPSRVTTGAASQVTQNFVTESSGGQGIFSRVEIPMRKMYVGQRSQSLPTLHFLLSEWTVESSLSLSAPLSALSSGGMTATAALGCWAGTCGRR
mmetsp:Transcript_76355/g.210812  ORF Transcript_76355/g.210812 Transcript_76355/m.210812 type:complete len:326 (-) Transcript_76355:2622-3599(-)